MNVIRNEWEDDFTEKRRKVGRREREGNEQKSEKKPRQLWKEIYGDEYKE